MWPYLLDMTKDESLHHLRCLELDAFSALVTALRAQGHLDRDKLKLLKETGLMLGITKERYKAEIRRVVNDERLNTIAYHVNGGRYNAEDWAEEGQRLIPLIPRIAPQTLYSAIADDVADSASRLNRTLPLPSSTERKRSTTSPPTHSACSSDLLNNVQFRPTDSDSKKRKLGMENSSLAQHLMAPPKISKIQQIYRQRTKSDQLGKMKLNDSDKHELLHHHMVTRPNQHMPATHLHQQPRPRLMVNPAAMAFITPKINIIQNVSTTFTLPAGHVTSASMSGIAGIDNLRPKTAIVKYPYPIINALPTTLPFVRPQQASTTSNTNTSPVSNKADIQEHPKQGEISPTTSGRLVITKENCQPNINASVGGLSDVMPNFSQQKVTVSVVSTNHNATTASSILQRTLTTLPFKNTPIKGVDNFKLLTTNSSIQQQVNHLPTFHSNFSNQKIVALRSANNKKIIPLSQVQVVNTKDGFKVFPIAGKIIGSNNNSNFYHNARVNVDPLMSISSSSMEIAMNSKPELKEYLSEEQEIDVGHMVSNENHFVECDRLMEVNHDSHDSKNDADTQNIERDTKLKEINVDESICVQNVYNTDCDLICNETIKLGGSITKHDNEESQEASGMDEKVETVSVPRETQNVSVDNHNEFSSPSRIVDNGYNDIHDIENKCESEQETVQEQVVNTSEDKVDSTVYIYDNGNATKDVVIDGIESQSVEVLRNVLEENFPQVSNITS